MDSTLHRICGAIAACDSTGSTLVLSFDLNHKLMLPVSSIFYFNVLIILIHV